MLTDAARRKLKRLHCKDQIRASHRQLALSVIEAHADDPCRNRGVLKAAWNLLKPSLRWMSPAERRIAAVAKLWAAL